jgi:hypothetical protein
MLTVDQLGYFDIIIVYPDFILLLIVLFRFTDGEDKI